MDETKDVLTQDEETKLLEAIGLGGKSSTSKTALKEVAGLVSGDIATPPTELEETLTRTIEGHQAHAKIVSISHTRRFAARLYGVTDSLERIEDDLAEDLKIGDLSTSAKIRIAEYLHKRQESMLDRLDKTAEKPKTKIDIHNDNRSVTVVGDEVKTLFDGKVDVTDRSTRENLREMLEIVEAEVAKGLESHKPKDDSE